jgi:hypothetical protein
MDYGGTKTFRWITKLRATKRPANYTAHPWYHNLYDSSKRFYQANEQEANSLCYCSQGRFLLICIE